MPKGYLSPRSIRPVLRESPCAMNVEFFPAKSEALPILSAQLRFSVASLRSPRKANQISLFGMRGDPDPGGPGSFAEKAVWLAAWVTRHTVLT